MIIIFYICQKKTMPSFNKLRVSSITRITPMSVVVSFEVTNSLKEAYFYKSGQYITLETTIKEKIVRRSYSICSESSSGKLEIGIKEVPNGLFSSYINKSLIVGETIKVGTPEGRFVYSPSSSKEPIIGVAAGSGITPVFSILKSVIAADSENTFVLIYGNKTVEETMFYEELKDLEKIHSEQLKVHWVFSKSNLESTTFGRIDASIINYVLNQQAQMPKAFYLCGPEPMIHLVSNQLKEKGITKEHIHFELFTASTDKVLLESKVENGTFGLTYDSVSHTLDLVPGKTLLDIALLAKLDVPYSCQGGVCCSCIARVTLGKASMESNQILSDTEINEGLILTCQAVAQSERISVDYDDV